MKLISICFAGMVLMVFFEIFIIKKLSMQIKKMNNDIAQANHHIGILKEDIVDSWKHEQATLNIGDILDEHGNKIDIEYFDQIQPILLFRFSKINCTDCIVKQIDLIKKYSNRLYQISDGL